MLILLLPVFLLIIFFFDVNSSTVVGNTADITDVVNPWVSLRIYTEEYQQQRQITSLLHAQCVIPFHNQNLKRNHFNNDTGNITNFKELCCRTILDRYTTKMNPPQYPSEMTNNNNNNNNDDDDNLDTNINYLMNRCRNNIISSTFDVHPYFYTSDSDHPTEQTFLVYSWSYYVNDDDTDDDHHNDDTIIRRIISKHQQHFYNTSSTTSTTTTSTTTNTANSIVSPPPYAITNSSMLYHSDDINSNNNNIHRPNTNTTTILSTSLTPPHSSSSTTLLWIHLASTTLSVSGGMHRTMDHTITIQQQQSSLPLPSLPYNVTLYMLFHLPSHLFINTEDCFQYDTTTKHKNDNDNNFLQVHLQSLRIVSPLLPEELKIDQEEPEFVSLAHIILIQIQLLLVVPTKTPPPTPTDVVVIPRNFTSMIHFSTKLHLRYPKPFPLDPYRRSGDDTTMTTFRYIPIAPPILTSGQVTTINDDDIRVILQQDESPQSILQLWIAAGHQSRFTMTIVTTIVVAIVGSMIMLYDLSTITHWD